MENEISVSEVYSRLKNGEKLNLIDVRTKEEYDRGRLDGSILLTLDEISKEAMSEINFGEDKLDEEIIVYCLSGPRGSAAVHMLKELGYKNVKNMTTGMLGWRANGYDFHVAN